MIDYVMLTINHKLRDKICIVKIDRYYDSISGYIDAAKQKACEKLGIDKDNAIITNCKFLGDNVEII